MNTLAPAERNRLLRKRYNQALARLFTAKASPTAVLATADRHCRLFNTTAKRSKAAWDAQEAGLPHDPVAAWRWYRAICTAALVCAMREGEAAETTSQEQRKTG